MKDDAETTDVRRCAECGREWEAPMGSPFMCPGCGLVSSLLGTHPLPNTTNYHKLALENPDEFMRLVHSAGSLFCKAADVGLIPQDDFSEMEMLIDTASVDGPFGIAAGARLLASANNLILACARVGKGDISNAE